MTERPDELARDSRLIDFSGVPAVIRGANAQTLGATLASQGFLLISGIIVARALGPEGRGVLAYLWLIPLVLCLLGGIGMPQASTFYVAREAGNAAAVVRISVRITIVLAAILVLAYGAGLLAFAGPDAKFTTADGLLSMGLIPAFLGVNLGVAVLLGMRRYGSFNIARIAPPFLYAAGAAVLFVLDEATLTVVLAVSVTSWLAGALFTWILVRRDLPATGKPPVVTDGEMLRYGLRGVIGSVSPIDDVRMDQLFVGALLDARALGLYVAAVAFANLPRFVARSIGSVAFPRIASAGSEPDSWALAIRTARIGVTVVAAVVAVLLIAVPFLIPLLFGEEFRDAVSLALILVVAGFFLSMHRLLTELARGLGHPGYGSITELVNASVFLVALAVLASPVTTETIAISVLAGGIASASLLSWLLIRLRNRSELTTPE